MDATRLERIKEIARELQRLQLLAKGNGHDMLAYLLDLAMIEANDARSDLLTDARKLKGGRGV